MPAIKPTGFALMNGAQQHEKAVTSLVRSAVDNGFRSVTREDSSVTNIVTTYTALAPPGTALADEKWQLTKIVEDSTVANIVTTTVYHAHGSAKFLYKASTMTDVANDYK